VSTTMTATSSSAGPRMKKPIWSIACGRSEAWRLVSTTRAKSERAALSTPSPAGRVNPERLQEIASEVRHPRECDVGHAGQPISWSRVRPAWQQRREGHDVDACHGEMVKLPGARECGEDVHEKKVARSAQQASQHQEGVSREARRVHELSDQLRNRGEWTMSSTRTPCQTV
jgi:hypothetical protein